MTGSTRAMFSSIENLFVEKTVHSQEYKQKYENLLPFHRIFYELFFFSSCVFSLLDEIRDNPCSQPEKYSSDVLRKCSGSNCIRPYATEHPSNSRLYLFLSLSLCVPSPECNLMFLLAYRDTFQFFSS